MPRGEERTLPKGQRYGAATEQQDFIRSTAPSVSAVAPGAAPAVTPAPVADDDEAQVLYAPTERPQEPVGTPFGSALPARATVPVPDMIALSQDTRLSKEFRGLMALSAIAQALDSGVEF